jgi:hypothetical protein
MPSVNWGSSTLQPASAQRVYVKQRWAHAWALQTNIWCSSVNWSLLPSIPTAELSLEYGVVLPHDATAFTTQAKIDIAGWWVKIEIDAADGMLTWHGFIDEIVDEQGGISSEGIATGVQRWVAYGMVQILAHTYFTRSRWYDEPYNYLRWSGSAIPFNDEGKPNRTLNIPTDWNGDVAATHVFAPRAPEKVPGTGVSPWSPNTHWSSRDIVNYIKFYANPRDEQDVARVPITFVYPEVVPDWDKPTVETEGRSILDVLNELVNPSRLMQIGGRVTNDVLELVIHSLADTELNLQEGKTHPANVSQLDMITWGAQDTNITLQESLSRRAVQIVAKGAKRQSLVTVQVATSRDDTDRGLIEAFDDFNRIEYDRGASTLPSYAALTDDKKKEANQRVRAQAKLADTYKTFAVNPYWTFWVGADPIFPDDSDTVLGGFLQHYPYWGAIKLVDRLPLKELYNYDQAVPLTTIPFAILSFEDQHLTKYRKPFALFERPAEAKYIDAEKMANGDDPKFSCYTGLSKEDQAITLDVTGAYQHAIAYSRFTALPVDDEDNGQWDYTSSFFTVSLQEDRFLESVYPATADLPNVDVVRQRLIYAGEAYERVYVAADTVYDVTDEGELRKINGGAPVVHFRNDRAALDSLVTIANSWLGATRKVLRLVSARPSATPLVGQLVTTVNADTAQASTVNTVISEIGLQMRRGADLPIAVAEYSIATAMGELDPLQFMPRQERVT